MGILLAGFSSRAQKVKYKDLYVLLRAKNYADASGFLVKFLAEEPDHPNANYQMGLMLENKLKELDLLKQTDAIVQRADSAILYLNKAHDLIDDKELKKHDDDYYELFKRRNLRTGKFEVILSDVQLDIEKRIEGLNALKQEVGGVKERFTKAQNYYESALSTYSALKEKYGDELTMAFAASDSTMLKLIDMATSYDSAVFNLEAYRKARQTFEGDSYEKILIETKSIEGFSEAALNEPDFYSRKIDLYEFNAWSASQQAQYKSKREFMRNIIEFDNSLNKMSETIAADSADLSSEAFGMITSSVLKELKMVDNDSRLMNLFQYKISQLNLRSAWMGWYTSMVDSANVAEQLDYLKKIRSQYDGVVKLSSSLTGMEEGPFLKRYNKFVAAQYSGATALKAYVYKQKELVEKDGKKLNELDSLLAERDTYGLWHGEKINLLANTKDSTNYITTYTDSQENAREVIVTGVSRGETPEFFFGLVPSSRFVDSLYFSKIPEFIAVDSLDSVQISPLKLSTGEYLIAYLAKADDGTLNTALVLASVDKGVLWVKEERGLEPSAKVEETEGKITIVQEGKDPIFYSLDGTRQ